MGSAGEDVLDTSKLCFDGDFDTQFQNILLAVRLTRRQVDNISYLLADLKRELSRIWRDCVIHPFGSVIIGLGIKTSDVDCYVEKNCLTPPDLCVMEAKEAFRRRPTIFRKVFVIPAAKIPIVKLFHLPSQYNSDISFSGFAGVRNSKLLAYMLHLDDRAIQLAILVKYWSKVNDFTGTNLMPNYALTLLVVFYLQHKGILPSVLNLQKDTGRFMVDQWNTGFSERGYVPVECNATMYELLGEFFKYYSTFDFTEYIVSPYVGYRINRKAFSNLKNVPNDFVLYKQNLGARMCKSFRLDSFMCIQDTFEHNRNCSVAVYPRLAVKIISHFKYAAELYDKVDSKNFLKMLLTEDPNSEPRAPPAPLHNTNRVNKHLKNNKQLFKKNIKNLFKNGLLSVDSFPKKRR